MDLGQNITYCRKELNLTQAELGQKLNVTAQAVSKWENNQAQPGIEMLKIMSQFFNITIDILIGGDVKTARENKKVEQEEGTSSLAKGLLGTCTKCGTAVFDDNVGEKAPKILCAQCLTAKQSAVQARSIEFEKKHKKSKSWLIIKFFLSAIAPIVLGVLIFVYDFKIFNNLLYDILIFVFIFYALYAFIYQMLTPSSFIFEMFLEIAGFGIKIPGVIFSLDLGGLAFLIVAKIIFWALSWLITVLAVIVGTIVCLLSGTVFFPFVLIKNIKDIRGNS